MEVVRKQNVLIWYCVVLVVSLWFMRRAKTN
jgi:hypothetical protein